MSHYLPIRQTHTDASLPVNISYVDPYLPIGIILTGREVSIYSLLHAGREACL